MSVSITDSRLPAPGFTAIDHVHMTRALRLAERGLYTTQPNPRVGCVIAHGERIVGDGWHQRAGAGHAEVFALRAAGEQARGATAYVTLEPCGLHGRTPPCVDALIAAGVARVVIASEDKFQQPGGAMARLSAAGIVVDSGLMRDAARELNRGFFSRIERGRPWVRVKLALSLDGRTALRNGESKWITGEAARADVQRWRARSSAILTGSGTVLSDNPRLTVRAFLLPPGEGGAQRRMREESSTSQAVHESPSPFPHPPSAPRIRSGAGSSPDGRREASTEELRVNPIVPLRVVLDRTLRTPQDANVLDASTPTLIFHAAEATPSHRGFDRVECVVVGTSDGRLDLDAVLRTLGTRGINELQVEAGPTLCGALMQAGLVDELLLYTAPVLLGEHGRPLLVLPELTDMAQVRRLRIVDQRHIGDDSRILYRE
jgi:diaminohydroxyphosphoribosylaminopyrimidine deaminase/5-amino-6-(5-phosphoribosylamino)uracil reductase